ncbi:hypothetical protein [Streptomyces radicis]|uniref:Uncharacterized protein n=1 Tax=Streptomyces radicis TaxID=1750517 RepID=A0A3A9VS06_9ACTN|nr:hypothetical protein [Streptomyces radicis]RKN03668.1 hypothetical protein D7319_31130 [Streptomyces radicis]RKN13512.1 hypothetical protein D7318_31125 [Streptomyces radicis]
MVPPLTVVAIVHAGSGGGWSQHACRACLVAERLIPFSLHPLSARGTRLTYPDVVPNELVARLAALEERAGLIPLVSRLMNAVARSRDRAATADERAVALDDARAAVAKLREVAR